MATALDELDSAAFIMCCEFVERRFDVAFADMLGNLLARSAGWRTQTGSLRRT